jgi:RNA polymerase sigma factor (TIGR02999 family)
LSWRPTAPPSRRGGARPGGSPIEDPTSRTVTGLLHAWRAGDTKALDELLPLVYDHLRRLARSYLRSERSGHTLQTTALVHEAYLRLVGADIPWKDRVHFYAVAAQAMRRILVDHARAHRSARRGGGAPKQPLEEALTIAAEEPEHLLHLDDALDRLSRQDPRKGRMIELHFFGGLTLRDLTHALELPLATIEREMRLARAWLRREIAGQADHGA